MLHRSIEKMKRDLFHVYDILISTIDMFVNEAFKYCCLNFKLRSVVFECNFNEAKIFCDFQRNW